MSEEIDPTVDLCAVAAVPSVDPIVTAVASKKYILPRTGAKQVATPAAAKTIVPPTA